MTKQILLNAFDMNCAVHQSTGLWRHPRDRSTEYNTLGYWQALARELERRLGGERVVPCGDALLEKDLKRELDARLDRELTRQLSLNSSSQLDRTARDRKVRRLGSSGSPALARM